VYAYAGIIVWIRAWWRAVGIVAAWYSNVVLGMRSRSVQGLGLERVLHGRKSSGGAPPGDSQRGEMRSGLSYVFFFDLMFLL
jgi:hypothetical protein